MSKAQNNTLNQNKEKFESIKVKILNFIKSRDTVNEYQVLAFIRGKRSTIIGRLSELQDSGEIYVVGTFNGKKNSIYKYEPDVVKQMVNSFSRDETRYQKCLKLVKDCNYIDRLINDVKNG